MKLNIKFLVKGKKNFFTQVTSIISLLMLTSVFSVHASTINENNIAIGSDLTYPPYAYMKDNHPSGFDVEFMSMLARKMKLNPQFVDTRFASLISNLRAKKYDVVASAMFITPERQHVVHFMPYLKAGTSLMALKDFEDKPSKPEELCGKTVGLIRGAFWLKNTQQVSSQACQAKGKKPIVIKEYDTDPLVTQALLSKIVDVQFSDSAVVDDLIIRFPDKFEKTSTALIYPVLLGIAVDKNNLNLLTELTQNYLQIIDTPEYNQLLNKYHFISPTRQEINDIK